MNKKTRTKTMINTKMINRAIRTSRKLWIIACDNHMQVAPPRKRVARPERAIWPNPFGRPSRFQLIETCAPSSASPDESALSRVPVTNAQLLKIGKTHRPPQQWYEGDEEDLF